MTKEVESLRSRLDTLNTEKSSLEKSWRSMIELILETER